MKKFLISIGLLCTVLVVQGQDRLNADSLRAVLFRTNSDTAKIRLLLAIGDLYKYHSDSELKNDSAKFFYRQAEQLNHLHQITAYRHRIELAKAEQNFSLQNDQLQQTLRILDDCKRTGDKRGEMLSLEYLASFSSHKSKFQDELNYFQHAIILAREIKDKWEEWNINTKIGLAEVVLGKFDTAERALLEEIKESKKAGLSNLMLTYHALSYLYIYKIEYNKGLDYALKAYQLMQVTRDSSRAYSIMECIQYLYQERGDFDQALLWTRKNLAHLDASKNRSEIFRCCTKVVMLLQYTGKSEEGLRILTDIFKRYPPKTLDEKRQSKKDFGICYMGKKDYAKAELSYLEMMKIHDEQGDAETTPEIADDFSHMGYLYQSWKRFDKAKFYYTKSLEIFERIKLMGNILANHLSLFKIDSALGDWQSAVKHLQRYGKLKDSMFNITKNKQIEELTIKYQTDEKEKDLKLARNKARLDQVTLAHVQNTRNWMIAGAGLFLIIAGLLYRQNRLKQKNNQVITQKNELITHKNELITQKNELLQNLVTEKDWLLKEVHHRVKNNLQIVMSLLSTQSAYLENTAALAAITESRNRVQAISLIHQKLYSGSNVASIDMPSYVSDLVSYLCDGFDTLSRHICFKQMIEPLKVDIAQAVPLGLILNEAITNGIKYAFDEKGGQIIVGLQKIGEDHLLLTIADDGKGLPADFDLKKSNSLGMEMMKALSKQLGGSFEVRNQSGVEIMIQFKIEEISNKNIISVGFYD